MKRIFTLFLMLAMNAQAETLSNLVQQARAAGLSGTVAIRNYLLAVPITGTNYIQQIVTNDVWMVWRADTFNTVKTGAGLVAADRQNTTSAITKLLTWANATPQTTRVQRTLAVSVALDYFLSGAVDDPVKPVTYTNVVPIYTYGSPLWTNGVLTGEMIESVRP